jgi:hypothetical protein
MSNTTRQGGADAPSAIPIEASRRGAHRARPNPWFGVLPALAVAAVVVAVAVLTYTLFGNNGSSSSSTAGNLSPTAGAGASAGAVPASSATTGASVIPPSPAPVASAAGGSSPQPTATGGIDTTVTLHFFNGTRPNVQGVSRLASEKFTALGWKVGPYAAWAGPAVTQTTIYYGKPEQKATAQTVAATLGVGTVKLSAARAGKGIVIVVSNDYKP